MDDSMLLATIEHDDSYRVIRVLGQSPSGSTELVKGKAAELLVRKRIPNELANVRAWQALAAIRSPLLPQVRDLYQLPDQLVAITTYVEGVSLSELVPSAGPLSVREAVAYLMELCAAASVLHANGIVHRDITPGNVVVSMGHARLIDLGNARAYDSGAESDTTHLGTWGFAAPEQYGFAQTDARSDVYSLGGLLGYLLTGIRPGEDGFESALADETRVPRELHAAVQRARAFEPSARFQSAGELAAALRAVVEPFAADVMPRAVMPGPAEAPSDDPQQPAQPLPVGKSPLYQWLLPVPPGPRHRWSEISLFGKAIIIFAWVAAFFAGSAFVAAGFDSTLYVNPGDPFAFAGLGITWGVSLCLLAREVQLCVASFVPGRNAADIIKLFLVRLVTLGLLCLAVSVAVVLISLLPLYFGKKTG